ncbi:MAG TPA: hypothetical protein IGS17_14980 [Oscillatoriales cyanobacterium M59_W2019_021]|nr:MAG: hypothetical protein D6728_20910 [Cyanobacteria bacterium J055]HIK31152.1 hypothetical protein [Oscillatoriales cyanobacterium M4454_W2019_049]HIK52210.1 hypothetical protein [Oscillatoriales cyanobacterium M59_W2019_021]
MLTHQRKPVCLSLVSTDLPIWSVVETAATLYQKDRERFDVLLNEPSVRGWQPHFTHNDSGTVQTENSSRLLWLEISPYRTIITMQERGALSYRHLLERGMYGISRYWLRSDDPHEPLQQIRLRNYTRSLTLVSRPFLRHLRLEYELWTGKVRLGRYVLNLEIHQ